VDGELICANPRAYTCGVEGDLIGANLETSALMNVAVDCPCNSDNNLLPPMSAFEYGEHHVDDAGSQILSASFTEQTISTMTGASGTNNMSSVRRQLVVPHHTHSKWNRHSGKKSKKKSQPKKKLPTKKSQPKKKQPP